MIPGEVVTFGDEIGLNAGRETRTIDVRNLGDRPVQVGSHCHFFEVNRWLRFDRRLAYGFRLDVPAGTSVRFEPGEERPVQLVALAGRRIVRGINGLASGELADPHVRGAALARAQAHAR